MWLVPSRSINWTKCGAVGWCLWKLRAWPWVWASCCHPSCCCPGYNGHPPHCTPSPETIGLSPCRVVALLPCGTKLPSAHTTPALPHVFFGPRSCSSPRLVVLPCRTTSPGDWDPAGLGSLPYGMLLILNEGTLGFWLLAEHTAFFKSSINSNTIKGRSSLYFFPTLLLYSPYVVPIGGIWALSKVSAAWLASVPSTYGL